VVPRILPELLASPDADKRARVMKAMLAMKKMDIKTLEEA
jgi:predicted 3-demethylubiquinone-9 3-methyltransferase (glyoxalase superfamily)